MDTAAHQAVRLTQLKHDIPRWPFARKDELHFGLSMLSTLGNRARVVADLGRLPNPRTGFVLIAPRNWTTCSSPGCRGRSIARTGERRSVRMSDVGAGCRDRRALERRVHRCGPWSSRNPTPGFRASKAVGLWAGWGSTPFDCAAPFEVYLAPPSLQVPPADKHRKW